MFEHELPYGIKEGQLVSINEVERGLACNCICPVCETKLVAKKGKKNEHHFAHYNAQECAGAIETVLHLKAKEVLEETNHILIPPIEADIGVSYGGRVVLYPEQLIEFDSVKLEKRRGQIVPDIIVEKDGEEIFIEIAVTHFIDDEKSEKIKSQNISTIEIDLSKLPLQPPDDFLYEVMLEEVNLKKWVFNTKVEKLKEELLPYREEFEVIRRGGASHIDYCPLEMRVWKGKPYANLIDDCLSCKYMMDHSGPGRSIGSPIMCGGNFSKEIDEIVQNHCYSGE